MAIGVAFRILGRLRLDFIVLFFARLCLCFIAVVRTLRRCLASENRVLLVGLGDALQGVLERIFLAVSQAFLQCVDDGDVPHAHRLDEPAPEVSSCADAFRDVDRMQGVDGMNGNGRRSRAGSSLLVSCLRRRILVWRDVERRSRHLLVQHLIDSREVMMSCLFRFPCGSLPVATTTRLDIGGIALHHRIKSGKLLPDIRQVFRRWDGLHLRLLRILCRQALRRLDAKIARLGIRCLHVLLGRIHRRLRLCLRLRLGLRLCLRLCLRLRLRLRHPASRCRAIDFGKHACDTCEVSLCKPVWIFTQKSVHLVRH